MIEYKKIAVVRENIMEIFCKYVMRIVGKILYNTVVMIILIRFLNKYRNILTSYEIVVTITYFTKITIRDY